MKAFILATILLAAGSTQAASYQCWVIGQDATDENKYTNQIQFVPEIDFEKQPSPQLLYASESYVVSLYRAEDGKIGVATVNMPSNKYSAIALGGQDFIQLTDGSNKIVVLCQSK